MDNNQAATPPGPPPTEVYFLKEILSNEILVAGKKLPWIDLGDDIGVVALSTVDNKAEIATLMEDVKAKRNGIRGPLTLEELDEIKKICAANEASRLLRMPAASHLQNPFAKGAKRVVRVALDHSRGFETPKSTAPVAPVTALPDAKPTPEASADAARQAALSLALALGSAMTAGTAAASQTAPTPPATAPTPVPSDSAPPL